MHNEIYIYRPWNYIEKKDDKILLLWSDIPFWMVIDDELFSLLKMFNGKNTIDNIANRLPQPLAKVKQQITKILKILINEKIVYKKGNRIPISDWSDNRMSAVLIHPTNRCNLNCIMCCNKNNSNIPKKDEIDIAVIKRFLDEVLEFTTEKPGLSIIGGEPLLVPDKVLDLAEYAKEHGFGIIGISTNGTLVTREFAKKAKKLGLEFQVSIDGTTEEENDRIRGKGTFKKIIEGIKILKEEGLHVETNFTCNKQNYKSLEKYYNMMLELGVDLVRFSPTKRIGGGLDEGIETVPVDELLRYAYKIFIKHPEYKKLLGKDYFSVFANTCRLKVKSGYCGTGLKTILLNSDGNIYPCSGHTLPEFRAGNICEKSFSDIWQNSSVLKKIRSTYPIDHINEKCSNCMVRYWCMGGCRVEAYLCTHKMNSPAIECNNIKKAIIEMIWLLSTTSEFGMEKIYNFD